MEHPPKPVRAVADASSEAERVIDAGAKKRPYLILAVVAGAVVLLLVGYGLWTLHDESTDDAQVEADVVPLSVRTGGLVLKVLVQEDNVVKAGDIIMQLDEADQAARVKQAEAELETARAQAASAEA